MSEVKRYNPELEKDIGLGLPCLSMLGNPYGEWVHYQDYAELKAQRDALAAENARCKFEISRCHQTVEEMFNHRDKWIDKEWLSTIWSTSKQLKENTPATDAYLNSVRAGSVEDAAKRLFGQGYTFEVLTRFAAKLRAGKDGE